MYSFLKNIVLKNFFSIELTSTEQEIALSAVRNKYAVVLRNGIIFSLLLIPAIVLLDTDVVLSALIPLTMVSGTAWFAISLSNMKKKFETFGEELTKNIFEGFVISLFVLGWLGFFALLEPFWIDHVSQDLDSIWYAVAAVLGIIVIFRILYVIFIGSVQYDINDAMLSGQQEVAEKYFKRSLSILHTCADHLQDGKSLSVANYYIGVSLWEVFNKIKEFRPSRSKEIDGLLQKANMIIKDPVQDQEKIDAMAHDLIRSFTQYCVALPDRDSQRSLQAIEDELSFLASGKNESQEVVDTRLALIFREISNLIETQGERLFVK